LIIYLPEVGSVPLLPPVEQTFTISATAFLDGIDEMIEACAKLSTAIDEVGASADRLGAGTDAAAEGSDALTASVDRLTEMVGGLDDRFAALDATLDSVTASLEANTTAVDANSAALDVNAGSAGKASGRAAAFGSASKLAVLGVAAALVYSTVKAGEYQAQMTTLLTQAGVAKSQFKGLESGVLSLSGQVGFSPTSLAQGLYHVESAFQSTGITGSRALELLKIGAEGAAVGHSDLVDTVNALDAIMVAALPGVHSYGQAMGAVNSIIGSGDMTMEDFAKAASTGLFAVAKSYGQSLTQVGAALAIFGDSNIRGAKAGTDLRMTWQAVQAPLKTSTGILQALGLQYDTLARTMEKHGLTAAVDQFVEHLKASKVPADQWGQEITQIFGKRAGVGIGILVDQLDRFKGKLPDIEHGADNFGKAWSTTNKTMDQQWKDLRANLDSVAVAFGTVLLPDATKALDALNKGFRYIEEHPVLAKLAGAFVAVAVAMGIVTAAGAALDAVLDVNPIMLVVLAVIALAAGLYELYKHSQLVREIVADVANFFKSAFQVAMHAAGAVVQWFVAGPLAWIKQQLAVFSAFWKQHGAEIERIAKTAWSLISDYITTSWAIAYGFIKAGLTVLEATWKVTWDVISGTVRTVWSLIGQIIHMTIQMILGVVSVGLDLLTGHWSQAGHDLEKLTSTMFSDVIRIIKTAVSGFGSMLLQAGKDLISGLIHGIESMLGAAVGAIEHISNGIVSAAKDILKIFSPSKVMEDIGIQVGAGLVKGLEGTASQVRSAASKLATDVKDAFNAGDIGRHTATRLTDMISRDNTRLQNLASQRKTILNTIATAEKYASSTASNVVSSASLPNVVSGLGGGVITSQGLAYGLSQDLAQINQFNSAVKRLGQLGLNKNLLNQIIQAGPAQGLPIAEALLNGPTSEIQSLNKSETAISKAATSLGDTAAAAMYDSGEDAGRGFLSGLEAQQKSIEKVMEKIAQTMVTKIKKDLGIHSPSTVAAWHGQMFAEGLAQGMDQGRPKVEAAARRLSAATGLALAGGGGGGAATVTNHYQITIPVTTQTGFIDPQAAARIATAVQKALLQLEKRNPTPQTALPH
jgi:TP901 family phage tail tape measure protein